MFNPISQDQASAYRDERDEARDDAKRLRDAADAFLDFCDDTEIYGHFAQDFAGRERYDKLLEALDKAVRGA